MLEYIFEIGEIDKSKFNISIYREFARYNIIKKIIKIFIIHIKKIGNRHKLDLKYFLKIKIIPYVQIWCWKQYENPTVKDVVIPYVENNEYNFDEYIEAVNYTFQINLSKDEFNKLKNNIKIYLKKAYNKFIHLEDNNKLVEKTVDKMDIILTYNNKSLRIYKDLYNRLYNKYSMINMNNIKYVNDYIYCLYLRYSYMDADMQQLAIHPNIKKVFKKEGLNFELFGSSINSLSDNYCSLFYDIEKYFGSKGGFFTLKIIQGIYWCNPPYINSIMEECAKKLINTLKINKNVGFLITIPLWDKKTQNLKSKEILINNNKNIDQSEFKDYPIYYLLKPFIKHELIIPKNKIPYFSFKLNKYIYAVDTYILFVYDKLDVTYTNNIINNLNNIEKLI